MISSKTVNLNAENFNLAIFFRSSVFFAKKPVSVAALANRSEPNRLQLERVVCTSFRIGMNCWYCESVWLTWSDVKVCST